MGNYYKGMDVSELETLEPAEMAFVEYLMFDSSVGGNASEAYRRAFPDVSHKRNTVWCEASKLKTSPKVSQWIRALTLSQMDRLEDTREQYLADLKADIEEAKASGNYGAAATLRTSQGKVLGYYIDRKEVTTTRTDEITILKDIASDGSKESIAYALKEAKSLGLEKELKEALGTLH